MYLGIKMKIHCISCGLLLFAYTHFCRNILYVFVKESVLSVFDNQVLEIKASELSDPAHMRQFKLQHLSIIQSVNNINNVFRKSKENLNNL